MAALSLPPWGFWPLGVAGVAVLGGLLEGQSVRARALVGTAFGAGFFIPGLWWMAEFSLPGAVLVMILETAFLAVASMAVPPGRGRLLALPAALVLAEAVRGAVPFGGLPMAGLALGQAASPFGQAARVGGPLLVLGLVVVASVAFVDAAVRRWRTAVVAAGVLVVATVAGLVAPDGGGGSMLSVASVQGGGRRGFSGSEGDDPAEVLARHLAAGATVRLPVDLVVWPEDVIDVEGPVTETREGKRVAGLARRLGAPLVAGVVEGDGDRFHNAAVVWDARGEVVDRFADLSPIPRDAIAGTGSGLLRSPVADTAVMVSYEVFFASRARSGVRAGGHLLLVPTNAASYSTSQVPSQQVATARLRAIETGRDLVQAAPTGYSAFIDHRGTVLARSTLGRRQVLQGTVTLRSGRTLYVRAGDTPVLLLAFVALAGAWVLARRRM